MKYFSLTAFAGLLLFCFTSYLPAQLPIERVTMDQLIGINARGSDPLARLRVFETVREYHQWNDDVGDAPSDIAQCPDDFNPLAPSFLRYRYNQSFNGAALINYDDFYRTLYQRTVPVLKGLAPMMRGYSYYPAWSPHLLDQKPVCLDEWYQWGGQAQAPPASALPWNQSAPVAYRSHTVWATIMAARYGTTVYDTNDPFLTEFLKKHYVTDPGHSLYDDYVEKYPDRTGLHYFSYLETSNEPEKSWYDAPYDVQSGNGNTLWHMTAEQYAAQLSANYDGHGCSDAFRITNIYNEERYLGIKNADPQMKVVVGGLSDFRGKYIEDMITWFVANRTPGVHGFKHGPVLPFDAINFHHYSTEFSANDSTGNLSLPSRYENITYAPIGGQGISPEEDALKAEIRYTYNRLIDHTPELASKEMWLTEFGYDHAGPYSAVRVADVPGQDGLTTQAQWLMRSLLETAASERIHRATLYELRDEPGLYGSHFGYSGLLDANLQPKPSWYAALTLKNVLTGYRFAENSDADNNHVSDNIVQVVSQPDSAGAQTRVYHFENGTDQDIFVFWSPTKTGQTYQASIQFPGGVECDKASLITVAAMDENGQRTNWSHNIEYMNGGLVVENLPVSETPAFLVLNRGKEDPPVPNIINLQATPLGCDAMRLDWTSQTTYQKYYVYYVSQDADNTPESFQFSNPGVRLVADNLAGTATSTMINDLNPGTPYWFYVVPVSHDGKFPDAWQTQAVFAGATPNPCDATPLNAGCLLNITPNQITYGFGTPTPSQVHALLSADDLPNTCSQVANGAISTNNWDDWDWQGNDPQATGIVVDFQQNVRIDIIHLLDSYGKGQLRFEYQDCTCSNWKPLAVADLPVGFDSWIRLSNFGNVVLHKLRITKLDPDAKIRKLFFVGAPANCSSTYQGHNAGRITNATAATVREQSAILTWRPAPLNQLAPTLGFVPEYRIRYSDQWNGDVLISPRVVVAPVGAWEAAPFVELIALQPGTTYKVEISPGYEAGNCATGTDNRTFVLFTTKGSVNLPEERNLARVNVPDVLVVQPSPAIHTAQLYFPRDGFIHLEAYALSGNRVLSQEVDASATNLMIQVAGWEPGLYIVLLRDAGGITLNGRLAVVR